MAKNKQHHEPTCMIAHEMLNKIADIIGHCDLLNEMIESDSEASHRLKMIRDIAKTCVAELREHERKAG